MYHGGTAQFPLQPFFDIVNRIMERENIALCGHLCVERDHAPARPVVVDDQIVDPKHLVVFGDDTGDAPDKFGIGSLPEQGADGVLCGVVAAVEDQNADEDTAPAVDLAAGKLRDNRGSQNGAGGQAVAETVRCGGAQGGGSDFFAQGFIVTIHIELYENRKYQRYQNYGRKGNRFRVDDLGDGGADQFHCHDKDNDGDNQAGNIFASAVAEGMIGIGLLCRDLKSDHGNNGGTGIREIVKGIRNDGDGTAEQPCRKFGCKQKNIEENAETAADHTVFPADGRGIRILSVRNQEMNQQCYHRAASLL